MAESHSPLFQGHRPQGRDRAWVVSALVLRRGGFSKPSLLPPHLMTPTPTRHEQAGRCPNSPVTVGRMSLGKIERRASRP